MTTVTLYNTPTTSQTLIQQSNKNAVAGINYTAIQESSQQKYQQTSDMTRAQSADLVTLLNNATTLKQRNEIAQNFLDNAELAMQSVQQIQNKLNTVANLLPLSTNLTPENKASIQTAVNDALTTMEMALSVSSNNGGYVFASSNNPDDIPVSNIVNGVNYNSDGTSNTTYTSDLSNSNTIIIADGLTIPAGFYASNQAFSDTITSLQMIRDGLASNSTTQIAQGRARFQTGQSEIANYLANNIIVPYNKAKNAIQTNDDTHTQIMQRVEDEFKTDAVAAAAALANYKYVFSTNADVLRTLIDLRKIPDIRI